MLPSFEFVAEDLVVLLVSSRDLKDCHTKTIVVCSWRRFGMILGSKICAQIDFLGPSLGVSFRGLEDDLAPICRSILGMWPVAVGEDLTVSFAVRDLQGLASSWCALGGGQAR